MLHRLFNNYNERAAIAKMSEKYLLKNMHILRYHGLIKVFIFLKIVILKRIVLKKAGFI